MTVAPGGASNDHSVGIVRTAWKKVGFSDQLFVLLSCKILTANVFVPGWSHAAGTVVPVIVVHVPVLETNRLPLIRMGRTLVRDWRLKASRRRLVRLSPSA
jgi:hypothetical protein